MRDVSSSSTGSGRVGSNVALPPADAPSSSTRLTWTQVLFFLIGLGLVFPIIEPQIFGVSVLYLVALALGLAGLARRGHGAFDRSYVLIAGPLIAAIAVSAVSAWSLHTVYESLGLTVWIVMVPGLAGWFREPRNRAAFLAGTGSAAAIYVITILQRVAVSGVGVDPSTKTLLGFNRNAVGMVMAFLVPCLLADRNRPWLRALAVVTLVFSIAALGSRAAFAGALLGALFVLLASEARSWVRSARAFAIVGLVLLVAPSLGQAAGFTFERFQLLRDEEPHEEQVLRDLLRRKAMAVAEKNPLFGVGMGNVATTSTEVDKEASWQFQRSLETYQAHNTFVEALAMFGFPGGVLYGLFLLLPMSRGIRRVSRKHAKGVIGGYASLLFWSAYHSAIGGNFFFAVFALVLGQLQQISEESMESRTGEAGVLLSSPRILSG